MNKVTDKICDAMLDLLKAKEYEKISITDLVTAAEVNRSSYYYHFYDKREVVDRIIQEICDDIVGIDDGLLTEGNISREGMRQKSVNEFERYRQNFDKIKTLYRAGFSEAFEDRLENRMIEDRSRYEYIFVKEDGSEERVDSGIMYNIKVRDAVASTMAHIKLLVEYGFAIPIDKFLDTVGESAYYHFKTASRKRAKRRLD